MTRLPAEIVGLSDRGRILPGYAADLTVFDPETLAPRSTYLQPVQLAEGVRHVIVGGRIALEDGQQTEERAGRFLRKTKTGA